MPWRLIEEDKEDVQRNLALDEAIARANVKSTEKRNTIRFWRSQNAVVVGRFQCVHLEVNIDYCREHEIQIARRFTGGGTVYQDKGNLNFSICVDQNEPYVTRKLDELYWNFIGSMATGLQNINIPVQYDPRGSCLRIHRKKITGTAGWMKQGISFIHGTLLIDANLDILTNSLQAPEGQQELFLNGKRVRCKRSRKDIVTTIVNEMEEKPNDQDIKYAIIRSIEKLTESRIIERKISKEERKIASSLYKECYSKNEWNLGIPVLNLEE
jgi:lipoate-protein ligase A